jgi:putative ABC transport system permease protein
MFKNYFRIAFRNMTRNKGYSFINILGLATGIAVCLVIFLVVRFETSFDNFHSKRDHIYRVVSVFKTPQGIDYEPGVPFPTAAALRRDYPQLKNVTSIASFGGGGQISVLNNPNEPGAARKFKEETGVLYAEPEFFDVFDFKWLAGNKANALKDPNTVLLTKSIAQKYFGTWQSAVGRLIKLDNSYTFKVTGILNDMPANTDFPLKVVISYATLKNTGLNSLLNNWTAIFAQHYCFVVLPDNLSQTAFNQDLAGTVQKYKPAENRNEGMALLPLHEMHYDTRYTTFNQHVFSKDLIRALSLIGLFVLVIACINFINLATAEGVNRSKEVGIRKVLGGTRGQLLFQFLSETALLVLLAAVIGVVITEISLPFFNRLLGIGAGWNFINDRTVLEALVLMVLITTLLAGFYPAAVLSGFNPVSAFKNRLSGRGLGIISPRRALVVLQFAISQALIVGVLIIAGQMDYFKSKSMGFDREAIVITHIPGDSAAVAKIETLRNQLLRTPGIDNVSFSFGSPADDNNWNSDIVYNNVKKNDFGANLKWADRDYPEVYHMKLLAGQFYAKSDTVKDLVVNETFLKKLGIRDPKDAINSKVVIGDNISGRITGVVSDFNIGSLQDAITPVIMGTWKSTYQTVNIKLASSNSNQTLAAIKKIWNASFPDQIFESHFLDRQIAGYYKQEQQLSVLYKIFAGIAIFISCLGLYSLASFMAVQRAKEVGIRKTLGASVGNIVYLFSREFTILIGIAFLLSAPLSWYFMQAWLQNYAFHITPGPGVLLLALSISVIIAWLSVGYKAIKAALANPVQSLKSD